MKEGPQHNDHSHFGSRKMLLPRIWSTWDHQEGCAHAAPWTSSQPEACLWRGGKWDTSHTCVHAGLFPSQAQQYLVTLSADLRSAYSSFRPLVPPQQRLLFSVTALLCHKGFFNTRLQGSLFPKKSSFSSSLTSISKFFRKRGQTMSLLQWPCTSLPWPFSLSGHANHWTPLWSYWRALKSAWSSGRPGCWQNFLLPLHKLSSAQSPLVIRKEFSILENTYDSFNNFPTSPQKWTPTLMIISIIVFSLHNSDGFCITDIQATLRIHLLKSGPVFDPNMARFHPLPTQ